MNDIKSLLKIYLENNIEIEKEKTIFFKNISQMDECCYADFAGTSIQTYIDNNENSNKFQTLLFKYIDEKNLKDADVYNKVHIDRRLFSKIRSDKDYHPSKETVILLAIALELTEKELDDLLESASYSLPKNNNYDLIIRFCFINKIFKLTTINELLYDYNCKLFNY